MTYLGSTGHMRSGSAVPRQDELKVLQQVCGGENMSVFKGMVKPGEQFQWVSKRHRGYPFSCTLYLNGLLAARISSCCEYRYAPGFQQGRNSCFRLNWLAGGLPCYRCTSLRRKYSSCQQLNNDTQENLSLPPDQNLGNVKPKKAVRRRARKHLKHGSTGSKATDSSEDSASTNMKGNHKLMKPKQRRCQSSPKEHSKVLASKREYIEAPDNLREVSIAPANEKEDCEGSMVTGERWDLSQSATQHRTHRMKTRNVKTTPEKDNLNNSKKYDHQEFNNSAKVSDSLQDEEALNEENGKKKKYLGTNGKSRNGERLKDFYKECVEMSAGLDMSPNKQNWFKANILERRRLKKKLSSCSNILGSDVELSEESDSTRHPERVLRDEDRTKLNNAQPHVLTTERDLHVQLEAMMQVLDTSDEVEQLVLRNTGLTDELLLSLAAALKRSPSEVTLLNLNLNHLGPNGAHILLDLLGSVPQVKGLLLFGNHLGDPGVLTLLAGLAQLQERTMKDLTTQPRIEEPQDHRLNPITPSVDSVPLNTRGAAYPFSLLELDLGGNRLTSNGLRGLAFYMRNHSRLQYLGLAQTDGADLEAWREFFDSLKGNTTLSHIILDESNLGDQGARLFAEMLRANQSLRQVDLDRNEIGEAGGSDIIEALLYRRRQFPLKHLSLEGNGISAVLLERIQQEVIFN
ncbi:uncharacterized protein LOC105014070 isoform X2 [Esox lucius]|uniref:uncharacterized protein LOC105014070 isoform X2 n=1 Tax=Esox lucius TaxID=8010 RepID=UPI0005764920|nr:uncharacterized protein LOC105014070 isoform X2 [Esox lucius]